MAETEPVQVAVLGDASDFDNAMDGAIGRIFSFEGAVLAAGAALGFLASKVIADAIKAMADFETAFTGVEKVLTASSSELANVSEDLREMATQLPVTAEELAGVAEQGGKLGIEAENITKFTETIAKLGSVTDIATEEVAQGFRKILAQTDATVDDMERLGAIVNEISNRLPSDAEEIVDAVSRAGTSLTQLGLRSRDILGLIGPLAGVGSSARRVGTAFRRLGEQLLDPRILQELDEAFGQTPGTFKAMRKHSPTETIISLGKAMNQGGTAAESLTTILSTPASKALRLLGANAENVSESMGIANSQWEKATSLNEEMEVILDNVNARWDIYKSQVHDVAIEIGQFFRPAVLSIIGLLSGIAEDFRELNEASDGALGGLIALTGAIFGVAIALRAFTTIFKISLDSIPAMVGRLLILGARIALLVGSVITLAKAWQDNWFGIRDAVETVVGFVGPKISKVVDFVRGLIDSLGGIDDATGGALTQIGKLGALFASVVIVGEFLINTILGIVKPILRGLIPAAKRGGRGLLALLRPFKLLDKWGAVLLRRLIGVGNIFRVLRIAVTRFAGPIAVIATLAEVLWLAWRDNIDNFRTFVKKNLAQIQELFERHFGDVVDEFQKTFSLFERGIRDIARVVLPIAGKFLMDMKREFDRALSLISDLWDIWGDNIVSILKFVLDIIFGVVKGFIIAFGSVFEAFFAALRGDWDAAFNALLDGLKEILGGVISFFKKWIGGALGDGLDDFIQSFKDAAHRLWKWLIGGSFIPDLFNEVKDWITSTGKKLIKDAFNAVVDTIEDVLNNISLGGILGTLDSIISKAKSAINKVNRARSGGSGGGGSPGGTPPSRTDTSAENFFGAGSAEELGQFVGFQHGGFVTDTGLALVHKGETILPSAEGQVGPPRIGTSVKIGTVHVNANSRREGREAARGFVDSLDMELRSNGMMPRK